MFDIIPNWHPVWVHFVIGLMIIGTLFYALAWIGREQPWSNGLLAAARWNLTAGVVFALLALLTGFLAAGSVPHDEAAHANMLVHRNWALTAALIFGAAGILLWIGWRKSARQASFPVLALLLAGSVALAVTGFEGGQNVFEHGLGVQRLPDTDGHDHGAHGHAAMDEPRDNHPQADTHAHSHGNGTHHQAIEPEPAPEAHSHDHAHSHDGHSH